MPYPFGVPHMDIPTPKSPLLAQNGEAAVRDVPSQNCDWFVSWMAMLLANQKGDAGGVSNDWIAA